MNADNKYYAILEDDAIWDGKKFSEKKVTYRWIYPIYITDNYFEAVAKTEQLIIERIEEYAEKGMKITNYESFGWDPVTGDNYRSINFYDSNKNTTECFTFQICQNIKPIVSKEIDKCPSEKVKSIFTEDVIKYLINQIKENK